MDPSRSFSEPYCGKRDIRSKYEALSAAAKVSRDFERKDTREEAAKAVADLKAKGMIVNELSPAEANRMRNKLTRVYALIGAEVGMETWIETQNQLMAIRNKK
jgi:TRAP-type transport system periplasmic protein